MQNAGMHVRNKTEIGNGEVGKQKKEGNKKRGNSISGV
jgi:hypothetical protein